MPIRRSSILKRTCRSHFNICTSNRGLQSKSHTAQRFCAFITTATKAGGGVLSKSSAPKRSCTATASSISSRSRAHTGQHRFFARPVCLRHSENRHAAAGRFRYATCAFRALRPLHHHKRKPDLAARSPQEFRRHDLYEGLLYFR